MDLDVDVNALRPALHWQSLALDRSHRFHRLVERRLEVVAQILGQRAQQLQRRLAGSKVQEVARTVGQVDDFVTIVDDERRSGIVLEQPLMQLAERHHAPTARTREVRRIALGLQRRQRRQHETQSCARLLHEDAVRLVDHGEAVVSVLDGFGHPQKQIGIRPQ